MEIDREPVSKSQVVDIQEVMDPYKSIVDRVFKYYKMFGRLYLYYLLFKLELQKEKRFTIGGESIILYPENDKYKDIVLKIGYYDALLMDIIDNENIVKDLLKIRVLKQYIFHKVLESVFPDKFPELYQTDLLQVELDDTCYWLPVYAQKRVDFKHTGGLLYSRVFVDTLHEQIESKKLAGIGIYIKLDPAPRNVAILPNNREIYVDLLDGKFDPNLFLSNFEEWLQRNNIDLDNELIQDLKSKAEEIIRICRSNPFLIRSFFPLSENIKDYIRLKRFSLRAKSDFSDYAYKGFGQKIDNIIGIATKYLLESEKFHLQVSDTTQDKVIGDIIDEIKKEISSYGKDEEDSCLREYLNSLDNNDKYDISKILNIIIYLISNNIDKSISAKKRYIDKVIRSLLVLSLYNTYYNLNKTLYSLMFLPQDEQNEHIEGLIDSVQDLLDSVEKSMEKGQYLPILVNKINKVKDLASDLFDVRDNLYVLLEDLYKNVNNVYNLGHITEHYSKLTNTKSSI